MLLDADGCVESALHAHFASPADDPPMPRTVSSSADAEGPSASAEESQAFPPHATAVVVGDRFVVFPNRARIEDRLRQLGAAVQAKITKHVSLIVVAPNLERPVVFSASISEHADGCADGVRRYLTRCFPSDPSKPPPPPPKKKKTPQRAPNTPPPPPSSLPPPPPPPPPPQKKRGRLKGPQIRPSPSMRPGSSPVCGSISALYRLYIGIADGIPTARA